MLLYLRSGIYFFLVLSFAVFYSSPSYADANALLNRYDKVKSNLKIHSQFSTPLYIASETDGPVLRGEVYGLIVNPDVTYEQLIKTFTNHTNWCEFIPLHLNVKGCIHTVENNKKFIRFYVGRKHYEAMDDVYALKYQFKVLQTTSNYCKIALTAPTGPSGTRNYLFQVEALKMNGKTLFRIVSQYQSSKRSRFGTNIYLKTMGKKKIGFSVVGADANGKPIYVKGVKGIIERNVVRYFLAGKAFITLQRSKNSRQYQERLSNWFDETERYHKQLYEMSKKKYLQTKLREHENQKEMQKIYDRKYRVITK